MLTHIYLVVANWLSINAFVRECPHPSQWNFRAKHYCEVSISTYYSCLFNRYTGEYHEICGGKEQSKKGFKYILTPNPHQVPCSSNRFQPFIFDSAKNSKCVFTKSACSEEGQIVAKNGESFDDRFCRCDYTRGYTYVTSPKDKCFCVTSQEDCSCYRKTCGEKDKLAADYRCVEVDLLPEKISCPNIDVITGDEEDTETLPTITLIDNSVDAFNSKWTVIAILIMLGLIFTTILLILYIKVLPQVKQTVVTSGKDKKLLTGTDETSFTYDVVEGESLTIECNIKSSLGIKSVIWQRERDGHKSDMLKTNEKYTLINTTTTALLKVNNFTSDDDGIYKCIVTNYIGLDNTVGHRCLDFLSGKHRCFKAMRYFPNFNREVKNKIKVKIYNFTYTDLPDIYHMEISRQGSVTVLHVDQRCDTVMIQWLKQNENEEKENPPARRILTRIRPEMSGGKYSGGSSDNPSLTIHSSNVHDTGRYVCILTDEKGDKIIVGRKLLVIPEEKMYREIVQHLKDKLYVKTSAVDKALQCLVTNGIVIIKGRKGTGKTKMCLELAFACGQEGFMPCCVGSTNSTDDFSCNTLYIIDDIKCDPNNVDWLKNLFDKKMSRIIITCSDLLSTLKSLLTKCNLCKKDHIVDLDDILSTEDKAKILRSYMTANEITETSAQESNFRDPKILTDYKLKVALDHDTVKAIVKCEPMLGFPLTVVQFCEDRKKLFSGSKFFTDPPRNLVEEFKSMYDKAVSFKANGTCSEAIDEYLVLTFIATEPNKSLDINNFDKCRFDMLCLLLFDIKCQHTTNIKQTANSLVGKYLKCKEDKYEFTHSCIPKAVFLSSDYFVKYIIENGSQSDILEFFRSFKYENVAEELILYLKENKIHYYNILCDRLVPAAVNEVSLPKVIHRYIYEHFIRYHDDVFLYALFGYLESHYNRQMLPNIPKSMSKDSSVPQSSKDETNDGNKSSGSDSGVSPWEIITLIEQLTNNGKDSWIFLHKSVPGFILLYGLVVACKNQYVRKEKQNKEKDTKEKATLDTIMSRIKEKIEDKSPFKSLWQSFDNYGNTFFHYIMLYCEEVCCYILKYSDDLLLRKTENLVSIENNSKISPLHIAAYLGKYEIVTKLMEGAKPSEKARVLTFVQNGAVREQSSQDKAKFLNFDHKVVSAIESATKESFSKLENSLKCKK